MEYSIPEKKIMTSDQIEYVIRINGKFVKPEDATVNIFDHGFLFGDSIYEVVQTVKRKPYAWNEHITRLRKSAKRLSFDIPWSDDELAAEVEAVINSKTWEGETYIRIIITRGVGRIQLVPVNCVGPSLIFIARKMPVPGPKSDTGVVLCVTEVRRNSKHAMDPAIKSGNYLNNVLAMIEAKGKGADDGLMLNEHGQLTEITTSNIFLVKDGVLKTPSHECGILDGITRMKVLEIAKKEDIPCRETELLLVDLASADEIFITGTIKGVVPVSKIIGQVEWEADPGPICKRLRQIYREQSGVL